MGKYYSTSKYWYLLTQWGIVLAPGVNLSLSKSQWGHQKTFYELLKDSILGKTASPWVLSLPSYLDGQGVEAAS